MNSLEQIVGFVTPLGLGVTLALGLLLLVLPRRWAVLPVIALISYMTMGQQLEVAGLNLTMMRLILLIGWVRIIFRREFRGLKFNSVDGFLLGWVTVTLLAYSLLRSTPDALVNRLGFALNSLGAYFMFRCLVREGSDIVRTLQITAVIIVPLALIMLNEWMTGRNVFAAFGAVSPVTVIRDGKLRCQGPFGHPILAGVFGAVTLTWFVALWPYGRANRLLALLGITAATTIVVVTASSTPLLSYLAAVVALALWPLRHRMRLLQGAVLGVVVVLNIVMNAPIWYLIARAKIVSSSTAYHRAVLVDTAIERFGEWWLLGTTSTAHWGHLMFDVANQYVRVAVDGGLLALLCFLLMILVGFGAVGRVISAPRTEPSLRGFAAWAMGAALFSHVVTFWGVSYWDQVSVIWYLQLAILGTVRTLAQPAESLRSVETRPVAMTTPFRAAGAGSLRSHPAPRWGVKRRPNPLASPASE